MKRARWKKPADGQERSVENLERIYRLLDREARGIKTEIHDHVEYVTVAKEREEDEAA